MGNDSDNLESIPRGKYCEAFKGFFKTTEEAIANIGDAKKCWLETLIENGMEIPEPVADHDYSGRFNVRVPKSLHQILAEQDKRENVSLNQLILYRLSRGTGYQSY